MENLHQFATSHGRPDNEVIGLKQSSTGIAPTNAAKGIVEQPESTAEHKVKFFAIGHPEDLGHRPAGGGQNKLQAVVLAHLWPTFYANSANTHFHDGKGPELESGVHFYFETFGFPVEAQVVEYVPPVVGQPARMAWHGWVGSTPEDRLDVHHAWLIEALSGGRVRVLTQETQAGKPAQALAQAKPNPMINGHQDWLDGMVTAARKATTKAQ